jgi:adenine deaminase
MQSDHECTQRAEAEEKLNRGMYIFMREGSTEQNLRELVPLVTPCRAARCAFATDDCHADLLFRGGHIDRCIRTAVGYGLELELALRMATLSPAERFGLDDRGALAPGRLADFCVLDRSVTSFAVARTFKRGVEWTDPGPGARPPRSISRPFACTPPHRDAFRITGKGTARVIGLVPHQIITENLCMDLNAGDLPDLRRDILKAVVCSRYRNHPPGVGLVHGFGLREGAIASSFSHDSHNIVAVGESDGEIARAVAHVIRHHGAMVAVTGEKATVLPLACAGLMSVQPYEEVVAALDRLNAHVETMGAIEDPFMYLSFLALTVIPSLRLTDRGVFDVNAFRDVGLWVD